MSEQPRYWMSPAPVACDLVGEMPGPHDDIVKAGEFVDGRTQMGPWANMCITCHRRHGVGLGTGKGQRYTRQADGRWLKTGG
jgi:hypothetical protein